MQPEERYSTVAVWLHWLIALTLTLQLGLGFAMPEGATGFAALQLHKSIGLTVLLLTLARLSWRVLRKPPPPLGKGWQTTLAGAVHFALYAFMILAPLTGWVLVSTAPVRIPTLMFGTIHWPHLPLSSALFEPSEEAHEVLGYLGLALIGLHVAGALRHHYLMRDSTLARIAPGGSAGAALGLLGAIAVLFAIPFLAYGPTRGQDGDRGPGTQDPSPAARPAATPSSASLAAADPEESPSTTETPVPSASASPEPEETAATPQWTIRPGGKLLFSLANGDSRIDGRFTRWSGDIAMDPERPESARIRIDVDLGSATVGDPTQDTMLRTPEFFGPSGSATWRSTAVRKAGSGRYSATGQLSLKGQNGSVPLTFTLEGMGQATSVTGRATIDRAAFGVGSGEAAQSLAPRVNLEFSFDAVRK